MYNHSYKECYIFNIKCYSLLMVGNNINVGKNLISIP